METKLLKTPLFIIHPSLFMSLLASRAKSGEEGGDDVKSAWPSDALGYTRVTMVGTMGCQGVSRS